MLLMVSMVLVMSMVSRLALNEMLIKSVIGVEVLLVIYTVVSLIMMALIPLVIFHTVMIAMLAAKVA